MTEHSEPPEVAEYRRLDGRMERGEVTPVECERYFLLAHLIVSSLGPYSCPQDVGVDPQKVAKYSECYPEASQSASQQCLEMGLIHSSM